VAVTRIATVENPGVVSVGTCAGQFLHFSVDAGGPLPIFCFASDTKGVLYQAVDFLGHPIARYEWLHLRNSLDVQQLEHLVLNFSFLANRNYGYTVEIFGAAGRISTVMQVRYAGEPADIASECITVVIQ
jgi:hypothetical protein